MGSALGRIHPCFAVIGVRIAIVTHRTLVVEKKA
jgi:hypothetical protein